MKKIFCVVVILVITVYMVSCQLMTSDEDLYAENISIKYLDSDDFWISNRFDYLTVYDFPYSSYKVYFGDKEPKIKDSNSSSNQLDLYELNNLPKNKVFNITIDVVAGEKVTRRMIIENILISTHSDSEEFEKNDEWRTAQIIYADNFSGSMKVFEKYTNLYYLRFTGAIDLDIETLPKSTTITSFNVFLSDINGDIKYLINLPNVQELMLSCGDLAGDIEVFSQLANLTDIGISNHSELTGDISVFKELKNLEFISMENDFNIIGSIDSIKTLKNLKIINFAWCKNLTGDLSAFSEMNKLQSLDLENCENITGNLSSLPKSELLHTVNVEGCPLITDD